MSTSRRSRGGTARGAMCVTAVCAGALAAHFTGGDLAGPARALARMARPLAFETTRRLPPDPTTRSSQAEPVAAHREAEAAETSPPPLALTHVAAHAASTTPSAPEPAPWTGARFRDGQIMTGATQHRLILFSFDDGPDNRTTPLLLDRLDAVGIKALFFLTANHLAGTGGSLEKQNRAIAREVARRGHLIGSHTVDHVTLPRLDDDAVMAQLLGAERIFEEVLGERPYLFRPPFGAHSQRIDQLLASRGYTNVLWNLGAGDFQVHTADEVFELWKAVFARRERDNGDRGGIILLHDTHAWSVDAFQRIVTYLMQENCRLLAEGEELFDIVDDPSLFYVPRGSAVAETEAPPAEPDPAILARRQAALQLETEGRCKNSLL